MGDTTITTPATETVTDASNENKPADPLAAAPATTDTASGEAGTVDLQAKLDSTADALGVIQGKITAALNDRNALPDDGETEIDKLLQVLGDAEKDRDAAKAAADKVAKAPKAAPASRTGKLRRLAAPKEKADPDAQRAIHDAILAGSSYELVASDGKQEIAAVDPVTISGDAFQDIGSSRLKLTLPIDVNPNASIEISGFGLYDEDGKLVAYCDLPDNVAIGAGSTTRFQDAIVF